MPNLEYDILNSPIDPQTGTPEYFNQNKKASSGNIDWTDFRKQASIEAPINQPIGLAFEPYGGIKSADEGMTSYDLEDIPEARAQQQGGLELLGKALGQAVTETTLGTIESAGYLLDVPGIYDSVTGNEAEFDNFFSKIFRDIKNNINDKYFPIYQTHAAERGDIFDATSLASNSKSLATSLTLMIPALGVARGINVAGKLAGMGAKSIALTEAIGAGLASRHGENTMEGQQYIQQYIEKNKKDLMPKYQSMAEAELANLPLVMPPNENGFTPYSQEDRAKAEANIINKYKTQLEAEASRLAAKGANRVYAADGALAVVDVLQYMPLFKGFGNVLSGVKYSKPIETAMQIGSEAFEEGFQQGNQMEAYESTKAGINMFGPGYSERLGEYLKDKDMKVSAFWGAMGGGVFAAAGPIAKKAIDSYTDIDLTRKRAALRNDVDAFNKIDDDIKTDLIFKHAKRGRLEKLASDMDALDLSLDDQNWNEIGITKEEAKSKIQSFKEDIAFASEQKAIIDSNPNFKDHKDAALDFLETKLKARNSGRQIKSLDSDINNLYKEITDNGEMDPGLLDIKKLQDNLKAFKEIKSNLSSIPSFKKDKALKEATSGKLDINIGLLQAKLNDAILLYKESNPTVDIPTVTKSVNDQKIIQKQNRLKELQIVTDDVIKPKLASYENASVIKEKDAKIKEDQATVTKETVKDDINNAQDEGDVNDTLESTPDENIDDTIDALNKKSQEESIDAPDTPDLRYQNRPNLFTKEMVDLETHVIGEYNNQLSSESEAELSAIILSSNAEEFNKNYMDLYNQSLKNQDSARLFATIQKFYENIGKSKTDLSASKNIKSDGEQPIDEFEDTVISQFYPTDKKSSDIGYLPSDEIIAITQGISPNRTAIRQFTITKGANNKTVIKRIDGVAELDHVAKQMPIDWDYVNNPKSISAGSEIYFIVNLDDTISTKKTDYHKKLQGEDFIHASQILIAQKDSSGVEHIISALPIYQAGNVTENGLKLKSLREQIWQGVKSSGQKLGMYNSGITTMVTKKYSGMLLISNTKNNPHEVLKSGEKLVFGIAKNINGKTTIDAGKNVDAEYSGIEVDNSNDGGIFIMLRGANGRIIPARCFTAQLQRFPELMAQSKKLLTETNKDNWAVNREQLRKIVYLDYNYIPKTDSFELRDKSGNVTTFTKDGLDAILRTKIVQVASSEINRGNYNETISKQGRLKTDITPGNPIVNSNFEFSLDYQMPIQKVEADRISINEALSSDEARAIIGDEFSGTPTVAQQPKLIENNNLPTEEPEIPDSFDDFENPLGDNNITPTRLRLVSNKELYQKWDELKETKWFKDRFPESLINVDKFRDGIVNISKNGRLQSWGMFKNAIVYMTEAAQTGTTYHEAFHVVFHLYLTESQRSKLLKENSHLGKSDIAIEEAMADKFMDYIRSEELDKGGLGKQVIDFFKQLYYIIKSKLGYDLTMDQVFFKAQHGMYKKSPFTRDVSKFRITRRRVANMTPYEESRRAVSLSDEMRKALDSYIDQNPDLNNTPRKDVIAGMQHTNEKGIKFSGLDMLALKARAEIIKIYNSGVLDPTQKASMAKMIKEFISMDANGQVVFGELARKSLLQFAKNEGLRIRLSSKEIFSSVDSTEDNPVNDLFEEDTQAEGWQISTENVSHKESLSNEVRKELSYIPQTKEDGSPELDDLGFIIYQDFNTVFSDLQRDLANSVDSVEMMEKLAETVNNKPYLTDIYNKLNADLNLRTKFFVNFQLSHVDYVTVRQRKQYIPPTTKGGKGSYSYQYHIFSSNRNGIKNILIDEWKDNSVDPAFNKTVNKDGSINMSEVAKVKSQWDKLTAILRNKDIYSSSETKLMTNILNHIGITVTSKDLNDLNKNYTSTTGKVTYGKTKVNALKFELDKIVNRLSLGENPFSSTSYESEAIDNVAKTIAKFRHELMESSFRNGENKTMYAHQTPTFLSRSIQQFKGKNLEDRIAWYQQDVFYRDSTWLNELKEMESRNEFGFIEIDSINYDNNSDGIRYTKMSPKDFENTAVNMYFNNGDKNYVYYKFPVVSDAPKMPFIKFRRFSTNDVVDKLFDVYRQEWARINNIKERENLRAEYLKNGQPIPDELKVIKNYDSEKSKRFLLLPFLNTGNARKAVGSQNTAAIKASIKEWMETEAQKDYDRLVKLEVLGKDADGSARYDSRVDATWGNDKAFHKDYFYNSVLANSQMMSIFSGDPAFYKPDKSAQSIYSRTVDYQKRNKQNVSPKTVIDVNAIINLTEEQAKTEGKTQLTVNPFYNTIYIKDLEIPSYNAEAIYNALVDGGMEESQAADIAGAYGYSSENKINVTDAQAYITLPRYREIMVGLGRWTTQLQDLYPRLLDGTASGKELLMVMQPIKPFYFGHSKIGNLVVPTQNKNSEYLLLPQLIKQSPELQKLYDHMINNNISSANFNSAVKAGEFGAQPLENIENASVHVLNNADYGLQQETPEHHIDSRSLIGSQIRKLAIADISEDAEFELYGEKFNKQQLLDLYHDITSIDLEQDYNKIESRFSSVENIQDLLLAEIIDRDMGEEREKAVKLVPRLNKATGLMEKVFNLPLFHPYHAKSNESLMNSVFKNNVTKQKIKGGAFVQVSAFGFDKDLKLNIKDGRLVSAECKLPWWSKKYFEPMLDDNGQLDINKVPENLREMIGYRIPTEDKYSMMPLIVTGFLPASAGGAVMLPMEITTISGSDFDIDKMYIMMPEWETSEDGQDIRKVEYDLHGLELQSKEARNNAKIDIIRAILTHSDTFAKIFKPGGFPTLSELADRVLKLEGKADEMLPMTLPSTQSELFNRNMTGKALIGIFANHNTSHAILQNTNIEFTEPIALDLNKDGNLVLLKSLHEITNANGDFISRNVAEWLAAVVDNAKNPLSAFINVNTYTADVAATLTRLGYPLETVVGFLSQPILKEFSTRYFNNGANRQAEIKIQNEFNKLFVAAEIENEPEHITTELLFNSIKRVADGGGIFTGDQRIVWSSFIAIKEQSTALADLVRATRADTKGAGPTLSENDKLLRLRTQVLTNSALVNVVELFDGKVYPMEKAFTEFGVAKPTEIMAKYFPWFKPAWNGVKDRIEGNLKGKQLSVKQIEQINYELLGYAASGFEFFDGSDRADIINNMAKKLQAIKIQYPKEFSENYFLNKLIVKSDDRYPTRPKVINFKNTGSLTEQDKQQVKENWMHLLEDDKFSTFAKELIKYSFYSAGFQITPNSFNHLIPVDFYSNLIDSDGQTFNEYLDKTMEEAESEDILNPFIEQFYKNNSDDSSFVPMVDTDKFSNITGGINYIKGKPAYFEVNAGDKSTTNDFVVKIEDSVATFSPFVSMKEKGVIYLYKANQVSSMKAVYSLTNKLGVPNQVLEYVKNGIDKSAIAENNPFVEFDEPDVANAIPETKVKIEERVQPEAPTNTKPVDEYSEIVESVRSKVLNEIKNDDTLGEYLGVTEAQIANMNIEELGDILNKICNR